MAAPNECQWVVTFEDVTDPGAMQGGLKKSLWYTRLSGLKDVIVDGKRLVLTFDASITRNAVSKLYTQQFKKYGTFTSHKITGGTDAQTSSSSALVLLPTTPVPSSSTPLAVTDAPAPLTSTTLALPNRVEDIKRIAGGLTAAENHNLALYFGMQYVATQLDKSQEQIMKMVSDKKDAAAMFAQPIAQWHLMGQWSAKLLPWVSVKCACKCRCGITCKSIDIWQVKAGHAKGQYGTLI